VSRPGTFSIPVFFTCGLAGSNLHTMEPVVLSGVVNVCKATADAVVAALWEAYKSRIFLGAAIILFSASGLGMILWSHKVTGWNQTALLGFGTSLLIVGTVELGILGVLKNIIEPDETSGQINHLHRSLSQRFDAIENRLGMPTIQRAESGRLEPPDEVQQ
jgi:hypothetical protein